MSRFNFDNLISVATDNLAYFSSSEEKFSYSYEYSQLLKQLLDCVKWYQETLPELEVNVDVYDYNENTRGNGYRSFTLILERCLQECCTFCEDLRTSRSHFFFRSSESLAGLRAHVLMLDELKVGMTYLLKLLKGNHSGPLVNVDKLLTFEELIEDYGIFNQIAFYGRLQGFYYCPSMRKTLRGVSSILASFSDLYQKEGSPLSRAVSSVINVIKYVFDPELRSQQIVNVAQNASVEFMKAFWSLNEMDFMKKLPRWICPRVKVAIELFVPPEPIILDAADGHNTVVIPVPSSHIPPSPVRCLLLSSHIRKGQVLPGKHSKNCMRSPLSPALLIHCHGGGFIAQSPESHEIYLRYWASELQVPVLSIDYSLAPAAPFPRALEEVLLVYAWCLKNPEKLGWTGDRICFVGDSAGGTLLMGTVLKIISVGIRKPDAILCAYSPFILDIIPSPSRMLCWLDPLLPLGFMISCLSAYAGISKFKDDEYIEESVSLTKVSRERKVSSISEIFSTSLHFIKQSEWLGIDGDGPTVFSSGSQSKDMCDGHRDHQFKHLKHSNSVTNVDPQSLLPQNDYVSTFSENYCFPKKVLQTAPEDNEDQEIFSFPEDVLFIVKSKCSKFVHDVYDQVSDFVEQNSLLKKCVKPLLNFMSTSPMHSDAVEHPTSDPEYTIAEKMKRLKMVTRDPFMSPLLASDDQLREMPAVYLLSLNFDPCLDDSITFGQRMLAVGQSVVIDVLDGLPHGFLNFLPFSQEAHNGSDRCIKRLREALRLRDEPDLPCSTT